MAVYTEVSDEALRAFLADYALGELLAFRGIAEGVENSNYALKTEAGDFILTLPAIRLLQLCLHRLPETSGAG
jgi:homoserine kinase type II